MILLSNGDRLCTGTLVNNTLKDFKPYFFTAFHCLDISSSDGTLSSSEKSSVINWVFRFRYQSPSCGGGDGFNFISFNGANFRSAYQPTDFALLELFSSPSPFDCISFSGWSKSPVGATRGTSIHHPRGDVKKISFDDNQLQLNNSIISWTDGTTSAPQSHWLVDFDRGTTEGGSSGSALFDQNHLLIGQLHGGDNGCAPIRKYYGLFGLSWAGGGTNDTRLSNWLDPIGSNVGQINTQYDRVISGPTQSCQTWTYIINLPSGTPVTWSVTGDLTIVGNTTGTSVNIISNTNNSGGILTATFNTSCGSVNATRIIAPREIPYATIYGDAFEACGYMTKQPFYVNEYPGATNYNWSIYPSPSDYTIFSNGTPNIRLNISGAGTYQLGLTISTNCGDMYADSWITVYDFDQCSGFSAYQYYPNPANSQMTVEYKGNPDEQQKPATSVTKDFLVELLNERGETLFKSRNTTNANKINFNTTNISNGTYYLHITSNKTTYKKQVLIQH